MTDPEAGGMSQTNAIADGFDAPLEEVADYQLPTPETEDPWMKHAGMFKDEPLFDQVLKEIATYRRELDTAVASPKV
jgi:hypothetical protein